MCAAAMLMARMLGNVQVTAMLPLRGDLYAEAANTLDPA